MRALSDEREQVRLSVVAGRLALQIWPLLLLAAIACLAAVTWWTIHGDMVFLGPAGRLLVLVYGGLLGSYVVHECAHVLALRRMPGVTRIEVERSVWRFSIIPSGTMSARQVVVVAAAGPLSAVAVGLLLVLVGLDRVLGAVYLVHGIQLLPVFGDGRALISGLRGNRLDTESRETAGRPPR